MCALAARSRWFLDLCFLCSSSSTLHGAFPLICGWLYHNSPAGSRWGVLHA